MDTFEGRFWKNAILRHFLLQKKCRRFLVDTFYKKKTLSKVTFKKTSFKGKHFFETLFFSKKCRLFLIDTFKFDTFFETIFCFKKVKTHFDGHFFIKKDAF